MLQRAAAVRLSLERKEVPDESALFACVWLLGDWEGTFCVFE